MSDILERINRLSRIRDKMEPKKDIPYISEIMTNISDIILKLKISIENRRVQNINKEALRKTKRKRKEKRLTDTDKIFQKISEKRESNPYYLQFLERNNNQ